MSQDIIREVVFLSHLFLLGIAITFMYDWFLIFRKVIRHNLLAISIEDLFFWIICAASVFEMLYRENNGTLRWFAVAGAFLGMLIYKKTISGMIVNFFSGILNKIVVFGGRITGIFFKPVKIAAQKGKKGYDSISKKRCDLSKYCKKKLTACKKVLKIILCKR